MQSWKKRIKHQATQWLDLPPDALLGASRVSCVNATDVIVENVSGLERVGETEVTINLDEMVLHIRGSDFEVTLVTDNEVHIHGVVQSIEYHRRGAKS